MTLFLQAFCVAFGFGFLIFTHELGHFIAAKICKVKILTFAFGFGPSLLKCSYKGTKYSINLLPFGGFVAMAGENHENATGLKGEYLSLEWYKKVLISFAGPFSNYILAILLFTLIFSIWGVVTPAIEPIIGEIVANYPAAISGLKHGDKIKSIDSVEINTWDDLNNNLKNKINKTTSFVIERDNYSFNLNMVVAKNPITDMGTIGINPLKTKPKIHKAIYFAIKTSIFQTVSSVKYLVNKIRTLEKPEISGPLGIIQIMGNATKAGAQNYLKLIAVISIALGLFNLFPIPMVDGGMIILFLIEGLIKKRISIKTIQVYNITGLIFIICIFFLVTLNDLVKLGIINKIKFFFNL
ncbi:MAG: site-2 protease family protein [Endomicrobium sp.]|jgi:regulator of sigma E protease|nr:site-2 protease family protein [Endomicrobium sp.]